MAAARVLLALLAVMGVPSAATPAWAAKSAGSSSSKATRADAAFTALGTRYLDHVLATQPQLATRLGVHDGDDRLIPVTAPSLEAELAWTRAFQAEVARIPRTALSFDRALEHDLLTARLERDRFELEVLRPYEGDPNAYLDLVAGSIQSLIQREFTSPCRRLMSVSRRLRQVPEVLRAARINLRAPSRLATEVALEQYRGVLTLYRSGVGTLAARCKDPGLQAELAESDTLAVRAVEEFIQHLQDVLPQAREAFALGRESWQRMLAAREMDTTPADSLYARGERALGETRTRMEEIAERIAPGAGVRAALDTLAVVHPEPDSLVPWVERRLGAIRAFVVEHRIVTLPAREDLHVRAAPPFRRGLSFASLDAPGVWEKAATEAYYNVTPVEPSWSDERRLQHLGFFNRWATDIVTIHEALPGHDVQARAVRKLSSRLRQFLSSGANTEGWAHYCEQMMIEQGYGADDPRYQLAQLDLALQRIGRLMTSIGLHTRGMSLNEAKAFLVDRCYMADANAAREARRAALEPMVLVYTLGKWRILELREELRAALGTGFDLRAFHDAFLSQGPSALPVVRAAMLRQMLPRH